MSVVTIDRVKFVVAAEFEVPLQVMVSERRTKDEVRARQVAIAVACRHTRRSGSVIGRLFGGRDHSTVAHAVRRVDALRSSDAAFDRKVRSVEAQLRPPARPAEPVQLGFLIGPLFDQVAA